MKSYLNPIYPRTVKPPRLTMRIWEGDFGVASIDPRCLVIMTLFRLYDINGDAYYANFPLYKNIPSLKHGDIYLTNSNDIFKYALKLCREHTRYGLEEQADLAEYKKYFMDSFAQIFYFDCWLNQVNFDHAIEEYFVHVIPFPFAYMYLRQIQYEVQQRFEYELRGRMPVDFIERRYKIAASCLHNFASLLNNNRKYLYKNKPTSLDAVVYGHLIIALRMPLQDSHLQELIKGEKKLIRYLRYISTKYFSDVNGDLKYIEPIRGPYQCLSIKCLILSALYVTSAMTIYAFYIGLLTFENFKVVFHPVHFPEPTDTPTFIESYIR